MLRNAEATEAYTLLIDDLVEVGDVETATLDKEVALNEKLVSSKCIERIKIVNYSWYGFSSISFFPAPALQHVSFLVLGQPVPS